MKSYTQDIALHYLAFSSSPAEYYLKVDTKSGWSVLNAEGTTPWQVSLQLTGLVSLILSSATSFLPLPIVLQGHLASRITGGCIYRNTLTLLGTRCLPHSQTWCYFYQEVPCSSKTWKMPRKDIPFVDERQQKYLTKQSKTKQDSHAFVPIIFSTFMLYRRHLPRKVLCFRVLLLCHKLSFERENNACIQNPKEVAKN